MALDVELNELIRRARALPPATASERARQRRGMIRAEMIGAHPEMTEVQVDALLDRVLGVDP